MRGGDPIKRVNSKNEDMEVDAVGESGYINGPLYDKVYETAEKIAGTYFGQYAAGKVDRVLKLIEDTAKWSLPASNQENHDSSTPLERPLPWIPFITLILMLRIVRITLSIAGLFIGNAPLVPSDVVYFIQTRRRKLRAIRIAGMKEIRKKEQAKVQSQKGGLLSRLTTMMSLAICRPRLGADSHNILVDQNSFEDFGNLETEQPIVSSKNQRVEVENISDNDLTLSQILDKYGASSNEEDDSDFIPPSDAVLNDPDTSSTSTSSSTSSETSDEVENNEEEISDTGNELAKSISTANPESSFHMTNGNSSIEFQDQSMEIKENGEHFGKRIRKPKIMPKPIKSEPMPHPIQEIKQEPADSDDETNTNDIQFEDSEELKAFNDYSPHQHQQSIVALENDCNESIYKDITKNDKDQHNEKLNGDKNLIQSEVFLTPATSAEDLFFSPVGSPDLCAAYEFQPTSILKNCEAVNMEKRGHLEAFAENEDFLKAESTNEMNSAATSRPTKIANHTGKPIKNKFRGKRR